MANRRIQYVLVLVLLASIAGLGAAAALHSNSASHDPFCFTCRAVTQFLGLAILVAWFVASRDWSVLVLQTQQPPVRMAFCTIRRPRSPPSRSVSA
jgi:hypothetical protein